MVGDLCDSYTELDRLVFGA